MLRPRSSLLVLLLPPLLSLEPALPATLGRSSPTQPMSLRAVPTLAGRDMTRESLSANASQMTTESCIVEQGMRRPLRGGMFLTADSFHCCRGGAGASCVFFGIFQSGSSVFISSHCTTANGGSLENDNFNLSESGAIVNRGRIADGWSRQLLDEQ